ncbi:MAG: IMPACT family protein [Acidobacteria bacterium]|nr:IMPACT family protein [Acidobacteriota bacterium]
MIPTLQGRCVAVLKVRDSRFIGIGIPVESEEEALRELSAIRGEYSDATHCCYAYRIGMGDAAMEKTHDASEPAGSAGAPILSVIKGRGLGNLMIAVVRYFGGTKLGVGGLSHAYRDAAKAALQAGVVQEKEARCRLRVRIPLPLVGEARSHLARLGGEVLSEDYGESAELALAIAENRVHELREKLDDLTRGSALWREGGGDTG